jgi:anti-repressor protein
MDKQLITIQGVRGYINENGIAQLNLEDVSRGLGFIDTSKGTEYVRWNTVKTYLNDIGFSQEVAKESFIPENIFYRLAMKAKNEVAEKFQAKVADEILPSIRKHGAYMTDRTIEKALTDPDFIIQLATQLKDEKRKRVEAEQTIKELSPAAEFGNAVSNNAGGILVRDYVKILENDGIKIGQDKLFSWLHLNGYIYRQKGYKPQWIPYKQYIEQGLFRVKETPVSSPQYGDWISITMRVTGKGQKYFYEKLKATA